MDVKHTIRISCLLLLALSLASCGVYTFNPAGKSSIKAISIERFENKTVELQVTDQLTDDVIDAFIADGTLKVVPEGVADALLQGTLINYRRAPYRFTEGDVVESYAVTMEFQITLTDPKDNAEIWTERMSQLGTYEIASETEEDAQRDAIALLVEAIINRTTKSW